MLLFHFSLRFYRPKHHISDLLNQFTNFFISSLSSLFFLSFVSFFFPFFCCFTFISFLISLSRILLIYLTSFLIPLSLHSILSLFFFLLFHFSSLSYRPKHAIPINLSLGCQVVFCNDISLIFLSIKIPIPPLRQFRCSDPWPGAALRSNKVIPGDEFGLVCSHTDASTGASGGR